MAYEIRPVAGDADVQEVLRLWRDSFGDIRPERFAWLYQSNGVSRGRCWVATTDSGLVVGTIGLVYRDLWSQGQACRGGQAIDLAVDRQHRTGGLAVQLLRHLLAEADQLDCRIIYTYPLPKARPVAIRAGFKPLAKLTRWSLPLSSAYKLKSKLPPLAVSLLAPIVDIGIRLRNEGMFLKAAGDQRVESVSGFDGRFDALWHGATDAWKLLGERTLGYLRWRFTEFPGGTYRQLVVVDASEQLRAYMVYRVADQQASIADLLFSDPGAMRTAIRHLSCQLRNDGVVAISIQCLLPERVQQVFAAAGFVQRPEEADVLLRVQGSGPAGCTAATAPGDWYLTEADRDV